MFAVFGVSVEKARAMAIKKTKRTVGKGKELRRLTDAEYQQALNDATEKFMLQMKPVILSPAYSSPSIALQFKQMAEQGGGKTRRSADQGPYSIQRQERPSTHQQKLDAVRSWPRLRA